jgi:hypothetical protein
VRERSARIHDFRPLEALNDEVPDGKNLRGRKFTLRSWRGGFSPNIQRTVLKEARVRKKEAFGES